MGTTQRLHVLLSDEEMDSLKALQDDIASGAVVIPSIVSRRQKPTLGCVVRFVLTVGVASARVESLRLVKE